MIIHVNPASGIPIYIQLMEQVKHAMQTGVLRAGEQIPTLRRLAEELVINPNTVVRAYRELEYEGIVEVRHGAGAFVRQPAVGHTLVSRKAQSIMQSAVERLSVAGLTEDAIRRLLENELKQLKDGVIRRRT